MPQHTIIAHNKDFHPSVSVLCQYSSYIVDGWLDEVGVATILEHSLCLPRPGADWLDVLNDAGRGSLREFVWPNPGFERAKNTPPGPLRVHIVVAVSRHARRINRSAVSPLGVLEAVLVRRLCLIEL